MKMRIDDLLRAAVEPEPEEDGFTKKVVANLEPRRRGGWVRRQMVKPALVAAALTLLSSASFAAIRTQNPAAPVNTVKQEVLRPQPAGLPSPLNRILNPSPRPSPSRPAESPPSPSPSNAKYGYTTSHTAWAVERNLRLQTETDNNSAVTGQAKRVTLTLENVGSEPAMVSGPKGCILSVMAMRRSEQRSASQPVMACAQVDVQTASSGEMEAFRLEPGQAVTAVAHITLPESARWYLIGQCSCSERGAYHARPSPPPSRSPGAISGPAIPGSSPSAGPSKEYPPSYRSLMTPPIHIDAAAP